MRAKIEPTKANVDLLAGLFLGTLGRWLTKEQFLEFCRKTRDEPRENVCYSHDYCDANMAMDEAFQLGFGCEMELEQYNEEIDLVNAAWNRAVNYISGKE